MSESLKSFVPPKEALSSYLDSMLEDAVARAIEEDVAPAQAKVEAESTAQTIEETVAKDKAQLEVKQQRKERVKPKARKLTQAVAVETKVDPEVTVTKKEVIEQQVQKVESPSISEPEEVAAEVEVQTVEIEVPAEPQLDEPVVQSEAVVEFKWQEETRFDCLLFKVDGLSLAVPMVLLGNIHPMANDELTPLFDQPKWFLGLLSLANKDTIRVVDTAKLVMPERYTAQSSENLKYAIGVHGSNWGFACHEIVGSITIESQDVKWRKTRTTREWLAGTVIQHMCALIDLQATNRLLKA